MDLARAPNKKPVWHQHALLVAVKELLQDSVFILYAVPPFPLFSF